MKINYLQTEPSQETAWIVKSYWMIEGCVPPGAQEDKILPDGYPELIFHYGAPYRIHINGYWEIQEPNLLAGQISQYFLLRNTGDIGMFALKLQPWAAYDLWKVNMSSLADSVMSIDLDRDPRAVPLHRIATDPELDFHAKVNRMEEWLVRISKLFDPYRPILQEIIAHHGSQPLSKLQKEFGISERTLERYCSQKVGLSPKLFARIMRFAHIFKCLDNPEFAWSDIAYINGFYDQAHFIKDFKAFSGSEPSAYGFSDQNMANFFLR